MVRQTFREYLRACLEFDAECERLNNALNKARRRKMELYGGYSCPGCKKGMISAIPASGLMGLRVAQQPSYRCNNCGEEFTYEFMLGFDKGLQMALSQGANFTYTPTGIEYEYFSIDLKQDGRPVRMKIVMRIEEVKK